MLAKEGETGEISCQWNFVNVINHPRELKNPANISTIRRTAMRAIHRVKKQNGVKQALAPKKVAAASCLDSEENDAKSKHLTAFVSERTQPSHSMLDISTGVDAGLCYTAHMEYPSQKYLLNHWTSIMAPLLLPVYTNHDPMSSVWVHHAFGDSLFMCTILLHAAVHLDMIHERRPSRTTLHFGMEAARLMNLRLNSEDSYLKDTSIAAVVMMLANQILTSNVVEMVMHLNALERMIEMKGGLNMLGMDGLLQMSLKWVNVPIAMFQNTRPRFLRSSSTTCLEELITSDSPASVLSSFDLQELAQTDITTALFHLRQEIENLTEAWSRVMAYPSPISTAEGMKFAARQASIEQMLLLAGQGFAIMHGPDKDARLREACCIAGSIYVNTVLWGFMARSPIVQKTLTRRLMTCVERFELEDWSKTDAAPASTATLFWALSVGGTVSSDLEERAWFILRLSKIVKELELQSWDQGLSILSCFLWEKKLENEAWKSISTSLREFIRTG